MSLAGWKMASQLPGGTASVSLATIARGLSSSGMSCKTPMSSSATGWRKSSRPAAALRIASVSAVPSPPAER